MRGSLKNVSGEVNSDNGRTVSNVKEKNLNLMKMIHNKNEYGADNVFLIPKPLY